MASAACLILGRGIGTLPERVYDDEPLGPDDASHRGDLEKSYVNVGDLLPGVTGTSESILSKSIIRGEKGAGKTHLLRHVERLAKASHRQTILCNLSQNIVSQIRYLRQDMSFEDSVTLWTSIWRLVFNRALLGMVLESPLSIRSRKALKRCSFLDIHEWEEKPHHERMRRHLKAYYREVPLSDVRSADPQSALLAIVSAFPVPKVAAASLSTFDFATLESDVMTAIRGFGPVHFLVDGLDEFAPDNPHEWLDVQIGLFKFLFLRASTRDYVRNVSITIALRNYVYHHAMRLGHSDRVGGMALALTWGPDAAEEFMNRRLQMPFLKPFAYSERMSGDRPLANWLGFSTILAKGRGQAEPVEQYLLRHSSYSPRDVVRSINSLCQMQNHLARKGASITPAQFRARVSRLANTFGQDMIRHATEEILSILPPMGERGMDSVRRDALREYLLESVVKGIILGISDCGTEVCSRTNLRSVIMGKLSEMFSGYNEEEVWQTVESVLWRCGIIAYRDDLFDSGWRFVWSEGEDSQAALHFKTRKIGFHSCMIDVCGLKGTPDGPIF